MILGVFYLTYCVYYDIVNLCNLCLLITVLSAISLQAPSWLILITFLLSLSILIILLSLLEVFGFLDAERRILSMQAISKIPQSFDRFMIRFAPSCLVSLTSFFILELSFYKTVCLVFLSVIIVDILFYNLYDKKKFLKAAK